MRILMPFWYLDALGQLPEMRSLSERVEKFHVVYVDGEIEQELRQYFTFKKVDMRYNFVRSKMTRFFLSRGSLYSRVKDLEVDVIYTLSGLWGQEFSRYCSRKMDIPYVVRVRGNHREVRKVMKTNRIKRKMLDYIDVRSLKQASMIIPISRALARKAEEWGVDRGKISEPVPVGVDVEVFKPMDVKRSSDFIVGYAGRISPEKRVDRLVEIAEKLPDIHFIIAGKQQMPISFPDNVEYLGELPFQEMPVFYNKVDLLVLPSVTEGFGCVILEAYACEKPVLIAREAVQEELKIFGSVAEIEDFGSKIRDLKNSDLKALGRGARSYVEKHYTWDKFGQSMIKLLKSVID